MNAGRSVQNISSPFRLNWNEWKHPKYANFVDRYASFQDWPKFLKGPTKKDLARAGFIYTGTGDIVTCFSCGLYLKDWEPFHDSYKEHLRWSKNCVYANMVSDIKDYWVKYFVTLFLQTFEQNSYICVLFLLRIRTHRSFEVYMSMVNHVLSMVTDVIRMLIKDEIEVMKETNPDFEKRIWRCKVTNFRKRLQFFVILPLAFTVTTCLRLAASWR